jgi:hypothetical protein
MVYGGLSMIKRSPLILTLILYFAAAPFAFGQAPTPLPDLASADWSVKRAKVLNAESHDAVWKFMNDRWGNTDLSPGSGKLCAFQFADLRNSGNLSLVVSYDGGGTDDCNYVDIYDKSASGIEQRGFQGYSNGAYFDSIQDLDGDGHLELIVGKYSGSAEYTEDGSNCEATQSVIYAWNGHDYVDVSTRYPAYYRKELASLRKEIEAAKPSRVRSGTGADTKAFRPEPSHAGDSDERSRTSAGIASGSFNAGFRLETLPVEPASVDTGHLDCARAEADRIMRLLGISRSAGIVDAIHWAQSDNRSDRNFADSILSDMGILTHSDANGYVYAKGKAGTAKITKQFKYRPGMFEFKPPKTWPPASTD